MISMAATLSKGWLSQCLGIKFDHDYYYDPQRRYEIDGQCHDYVRGTFPDLNIFYSESNLGRIGYFDTNQVLIGGIQPNMLLGILVGAEFVANESFDADITLNCLAGTQPLDLPEPQSLLEHNVIKLFDEQIFSLKNQAGNSLYPIPPFFWDTSGRAAIHGPMTTAQKFFGENFFIEMLTNPQNCHKIIDWIVKAYILLVRHYSKIGEIPISAIHVGECSACMIDPELFDQFAIPAISKIGQALGPLRLHSCGCSTHLVDLANNITNLISLDVGGETSVAEIRDVFGKDFPISIAPMATDFSAKTSDSIIGWAEKIVTENKEGDLLFVYHLEPNYNLDIVKDLHNYISSLSINHDPLNESVKTI